MKNKQREFNGYLLLESIGKGSYAEVFKCQKKSTGEIFAMKVFKELKQNGPQKIKTQVQIVQKLNHPNIIRCYDYFVESQDQTKLYAVFQYCQKGTLKDLTQEQKYRKNRFTEMQAKTYIRKILDALIYLHEHKIAHRDLKLDNILINDQLDIKLADFGLSKSYEEGSVLDTFCGTPLTMAPEIMDKQESYSEKCDTWSFGIISYFLIYLEYPFYHQRMTQLKKLIEQKGVKFPQDVQISGEGKDFLKKCLTVNPQKRPSVESLKFHPWFSQVACSKIRVNFMKQSMGESSLYVQKSKNQIKNAIKTQIDKIIVCTNLFPTRIEEIMKGFEEFYPNEKMNHFLFVFFAVNKLVQLRTKGLIKLKINGQEFEIENRNILKLSKHFDHIFQFLQNKMKALGKLIGSIDEKQCARSYQILINFFIDQTFKFVSEGEKVDDKKLKFFVYVFNFLNTILVESTVEMKLKENVIQYQTVEEIILYLQNILSAEKILKAVNRDVCSVDFESNIQRQGQQIWTVQYNNHMKTAQDDETWSLAGEIIERALNVKRLINCGL